MKLLTKKEPRYNTDKLHADLKILKIDDMYELAVLQFVYKCVNGLHVSNFDNYFEARRNLHHHNTRYQYNLQTPLVRTELGRSSTRYKGCLLWNLLNTEEQTACSIRVFKKVMFDKFLSCYH